MKPASLRVLAHACALVVIAVVGSVALAQDDPRPPTLTVEHAQSFLTAAGLQTCEVSDIDPMVARFNGAVVSISLGVAKDCSTYDPQNPTVVNVHQFKDLEARDAMVASLQNLRYRALRAYANVWAVDNFVIILLGPMRAEVESLIRAEYLRRHPEAG